MRVGGDSRADWRRWAILVILARHAASMRTKDLVWWIEKDGWHVLPTHGRRDSVHAACLSLAEGPIPGSPVGAKVRRLDGRPARWELTPTGRAFAGAYLIENPHITPAASQERWA